MEITHWVANSCACVGIKDLGKEADAKSAMQTFCSLKLLNKTTRYSTPDKAYATYLDAHYIFIAGPEEPGHAESKKWVRYGSEFAAFIRKNKLGKLATMGKVLNLKHHSRDKTTSQVWVWAPDRDALVKWWEANPPDPKATPQSPMAPPIKPGSWDTARGIAGYAYQCPHCAKTYTYGEPVWVENGSYFCESYGITRQTT